MWDVRPDTVLDLDLDKFHQKFGDIMREATLNLKRCQDFLRKLYEQEPQERLDTDSMQHLEGAKARLMQFIDRLGKFDINEPAKSLQASPQEFIEETRQNFIRTMRDHKADFAFLRSTEDLGDQMQELNDALEVQLEEVEKLKPELVSVARELATEAKKKWDGKVTKAFQALDEREAQALSSILGTKITHEWAEDYLAYISYDARIRDKLASINNQRETSLKKVSRFTRLRKPIIWFGFTLWKLLARIFVGIIFYSGDSYLNMTRKWQFWRGFWLTWLFVIIMTYLIVSWSVEVSLSHFVDLLLEKVKFVPLLILVSIGFAFASRNYRINASILEQYRQRYAVAHTLQNLLLTEGVKEDVNLRNKMIERSTLILFEYRPSGYMGKNDPDSVGASRLLDYLKDDKRDRIS